jgi:hypothetical protein
MERKVELDLPALSINYWIGEIGRGYLGSAMKHARARSARPTKHATHPIHLRETMLI